MTTQAFDPFQQQAGSTAALQSSGGIVQAAPFGGQQPFGGAPAAGDNPFAAVTLGGQAPSLPLGNHTVEVVPGTEQGSESGRKFVQVKGNGLLLLIFVRINESDNKSVIGATYPVKFWCSSQYPGGDKKLWDYLATALVCLFGMSPRDPNAAKFAIELGKFIKTEFWTNGTLNGHSLLGKKARIAVREGKKDPKVYWDKQ